MIATVISADLPETFDSGSSKTGWKALKKVPADVYVFKSITCKAVVGAGGCSDDNTPMVTSMAA